MRTVSPKIVVLSWVLLCAGCGADEGAPSSSEGQTGGTAPIAGGAAGSGGNGLPSSGGTQPATGGASGAGGSGGASTSGGAQPAGGALPSGGAPAGGQSAGGQDTGGQNTGGTESGGAPTGGQDTGGQSTGGQDTGGQGTGGDGGGGAPTGGSDPGSGGEATGGGSAELLLVTSGPHDYWNTTAEVTVVAEGTANLTVDENATYQSWDGFGGTFNEMGWDALSVVSSEIATAIRLLFDANDGANFVFGRIPIGASDYAMSWYTLAETAGDYQMEHFSIDRDREMLIPYIRAALAVKPDLRLWGSPWIVPDWMKDGMNMRSDPQTLEAHALYLAKFVEEYAAEGLTIEAVHPQNEPGYASVRWSQSVLIDYFKSYLGPKFAERGLDAEIWCGTMSHPDDANIATAVANDPESMQFVTGFGLQWNLQATVAELAPFGPVMMTEHKCGNYNFATPYWDQSRYDPNKAQNDHLYGEESWQLIRDWIVAGVNSYSAWNMVLDTYGRSLGGWPQNALLVVDRTARTLTATAAYYAFRHYSQYILPGATRLGTTGTNDAVAFRNADGSVVTEVYNKGDSSQAMTVDVGGALYHFDVPAHGWATLRVAP